MSTPDLLNLLIGIIGVLIMAIGSWFAMEVRTLRAIFQEESKEVRKSIEALNINVAKVIEQVEIHETRIGDLEQKSVKKKR